MRKVLTPTNGDPSTSIDSSASMVGAAFSGEAMTSGGGVNGSSSASTIVGCALFPFVLVTDGESIGSDGGVWRDDEGGEEVIGGARLALAVDDGACVDGLDGAAPFLGAPKNAASVVCLVLPMSAMWTDTSCNNASRKEVASRDELDHTSVRARV